MDDKGSETWQLTNHVGLTPPPLELTPESRERYRQELLDTLATAHRQQLEAWWMLAGIFLCALGVWLVAA